MRKRFEINPNTKERMDEFYNKFNPEKERFNEWMIPYLDKVIPESGSVLEIGCGFGKTLNWVYEKNNTLEIVGSDLSEIAIIKSLLDGNQIPYYIKGENFASLNGLADGLTTMDIMVREDYSEDVKELLKDFIKPE